MKQAKTLTNDEMGEKVIELLNPIVKRTCEEVVESIDMQLRGGGYYLEIWQKETLIEHLQGGVNLNLTINAGIKMSELSNLDIFPSSVGPIKQRRFDDFVPVEGKTESVALTKEKIQELEKLDQEMKADLETPDSLLRRPDETIEEFGERMSIEKERLAEFVKENPEFKNLVAENQPEILEDIVKAENEKHKEERKKRAKATEVKTNA